MPELEPMLEAIQSHLRAMYTAREQGLQLSRQATRSAANAIRAVHRGEFERAQELLGAARRALDEAASALADHPEIYYAGFLQDAEKEYAEGCITLAIVASRPIPGPESLGVAYAPYLNGLGEAVGELRRHLLDLIRKGETARCEEILDVMEEAYGALTSIDFPEAMTGGLRRTTDMVRGVLERTRGDLTMALRQWELERKLEGFQSGLG